MLVEKTLLFSGMKEWWITSTSSGTVGSSRSGRPPSSSSASPSSRSSSSSSSPTPIWWTISSKPSSSTRKCTRERKPVWLIALKRRSKRGEVWRYLSYCLVHQNWEHIIINTVLQVFWSINHQRRCRVNISLTIAILSANPIMSHGTSWVPKSCEKFANTHKMIFLLL